MVGGSTPSRSARIENIASIEPAAPSKWPVMLFVLLMGATQAGAQTSTITGKVLSGDDGSGLPGVSVLEKGTTNGTVTDSNGAYSINVSPKSTIVYSFV